MPRSLRCAAPAICWLALSCLGRAQDPPAPPSPTPPPPAVPVALLRPIESVAHQSARAGFTAETAEIIDVLQRLGFGPTQTEKLAAECKKETPKAKAAPAPIPSTVSTLRAATKALAKLAPTLEDPAAHLLAEQALRLDDSSDDLHAFLRHEIGSRGWLTVEAKAAWERRGQIAAALTKARRLEIDLKATTEDGGFLSTIAGRPVAKVTCGDLVVYGMWSPEKLQRVVRETMRAAAFSNWIVTDQLKPDVARKTTAYLIDSEPTYEKAIALAQSRGWIDAKAADESRRLSGFFCHGGGVGYTSVHVELTEADAEASQLFDLQESKDFFYDMAPCLAAGHLNWVCLTYLGAQLPSIAWYEAGAKPARRSMSSGDDTRERERFLQLSEGGVAGCRSWIAWLAARGEDPAWSRSMVDDVGKIEGENKLKSTFVVEYLQEIGQFLTVVDKTKSVRNGPAATTTAFQTALGMPLSTFEENWRRWVIPPKACIADRLDKPKQAPKPPPEVLSQLNELRKKCFAGSVCGDRTESLVEAASPTSVAADGSSVECDETLSEGCRRHALYLGEHPAQLEKWPDAHEEWPDQSRFSPEGAVAGLNSVIAPGCATSREALDGWLGTFYHRLPLLHPGLMRIGWGLEKNTAVLDSGSLARPVAGPWHVVWPYHGMQNVPVSFAPELPNPVPGEDQKNFGYPVTLQIGTNNDGKQSTPDVEVALHEGSEQGPRVECWLSSPSKPSNPDLRLSDAWCLIPKHPLSARSTYVATATWTGGRHSAWSFKTK